MGLMISRLLCHCRLCHCRHSYLPLPSDIIFEILLRLRVKTLSKFRCVSKSWYALISDPIFLNSHHHRSKQHPLLFGLTWIDKIPHYQKLHISSLDKEKPLIPEFVKCLPFKFADTLFTCLDLVCLYDNKNVYLCNPATEKLITLPKNSFEDFHMYSLDRAVLGYVPSTKDYKVLRINLNFRGVNRAWYCEVFTLGSTVHNSWRRVGNPPFTHLTSDPASVNGAIYLLPNHDTIPYNAGIARFDLDQEKWSVIPPPAPDKITWMGMWSLTLTHVGGFLCLADFGSSDWKQLDLWFLKDYDKGLWVKEYSIDSFPWITERRILLVPLTIEEDGRVLMKNEAGELYYYDPKGKCFEETNTGKKKWHNTSFYVESFMPLGEVAK